MPPSEAQRSLSHVSDIYDGVRAPAYTLNYCTSLHTEYTWPSGRSHGQAFATPDLIDEIQETFISECRLQSRATAHTREMSESNLFGRLTV